MNMHVNAPNLVQAFAEQREREDAICELLRAELTVERNMEAVGGDLEKLAEHFAVIERAARDGRGWPDSAMNALIIMASSFREAIVSAPCVSESDYRGKVRLIMECAADPHGEDIGEDINELAEQALAYRAAA